MFQPEGIIEIDFKYYPVFILGTFFIDLTADRLMADRLIADWLTADGWLTAG